MCTYMQLLHFCLPSLYSFPLTSSCSTEESGCSSQSSKIYPLYWCFLTFLLFIFAYLLLNNCCGFIFQKASGFLQGLLIILKILKYVFCVFFFFFLPSRYYWDVLKTFRTLFCQSIGTAEEDCQRGTVCVITSARIATKYFKYLHYLQW